jgi:hypothetical protein
MYIKVTCETCGRLVWDKEDVEELVGPDDEMVYEEDCECQTGIPLSDLERPFGKSTVEDVAFSLYRTFHKDYTAESPWHRYGKENRDMVVDAFRRAAIDAVDSIRASRIGG